MGWVTAFSNGEFLFFNTDTSEVTDNCPPELQDEDGSYLWISHDEEIYFPGKFSIKAHSTSLENEMISIENINGNAMSVPNSALGESIPSIRSLLKFPNDLIEMDSISQPAVYFTLRARFLQDQIYTSLGDILLIVNPFKTIPNPSMETISSVSSRDKLPPHPYLTAAMAYEKMRQTLSNQTILIGGESGSGKTETTKTCLSYLSHLSSQMTSPAVTGSSAQLSEVKNTHVEERIMASNPILEAFGNAKTIRNDNSSRFGKFLEIIYSPKGEIASCRTTSYLLEKCRVHRQNSGERNFHIFYQICRAVEGAITSMNEGRRFSEHHTRGECSSSVLDDENFLSNLNLFSLDDYDILTTSGCINIEGVNDCHSFLETEAAARTLGFSTQSVQLLISTCVAILHLGNIQFVDVTDSGGTESCVIGGTDEMVTQRSTASLELAAELLGIDSLTLSTALRVRKLVIRGEQTDVQLSSSQAKEARDSICKALYSNLFDWIVQNVTVTFAETNALPPPQSKGTFIGILDIFGFEIFDINYFEQLCINYANEKLQQFFNLTVFKAEQALYETEGIAFEGFIFSDNQDVLNLIEDKSFGILSIIDDEINIPRANDSTLLRKLMNAYVLHTPPNTDQAIAAARFSTVALPSSSQEVFIVSHYAGCVEYRIDGFLDTSRDKLGDDLMTLIDTCCDGYFATATATTASMSKSSKSSSRSSGNSTVKSQTLGKKFKIQLESLLAMLTTTQPHYIKCIKPNTMKVPNCFQGSTCFSQLQALGIFEAVAIRKRGYPCRVTHEEFVRTYGPLFKSQLLSRNATHASSSSRIRSEIICGELNKRNGKDPIHHFLVGKTKIFSKFEARDLAKKLLDKYHHRCVLKIQSIARGFLTKLSFCDFCYAALDTNALLLSLSSSSESHPGDLEDESKALEEVEMLIQRLERFPYQHYQRLLEMRERIKERMKLLKEIEEMQFVKFEEINSQWMTKAQYARRKQISTSAAVKVYEMYDTIMRGGDDNSTVIVIEDQQQTDQQLGDEQGQGALGSSGAAPEVERDPMNEQMNRSKSQDQEEEVVYTEREVTPLSRLMCGLCRKSFESPPLKRAPRYLSCLHTFCSSCLADRIDRSTSAILCPHPDCRVLSRCPEGLTTFKIAYALVHQLPPICRNCEQRNAVCQCHQCPLESSLLCMVCLKAHNKIKAYKKHSVSGLDSEIETQVAVVDMSKCSIHSERDLDAYCQTCQQLTCLSCAVFNHSNHTIQPFHPAAELERNRLLPCLSDLLNDVSSLQSKQMELTQTSPALDEQRKLMKELSNRIFQGLSLSLANRRTDFLSVLDLHYSQKRKALVDFTESLSFHIASQESSLKICQEMLEIGNDTEVLSLSSFFQAHLDNMILDSWQQDLSNLETNLCFSCGPEQEVKNLISSIGICRGSTVCADPTQSSIEILQIGEFCDQWQVFMRLTLRNSKRQKMLRGGHAVTIDVEEHLESLHLSESSPMTTAASGQLHNSTPTTSPVTSVPTGLGKSNPRPFSLKSPQVISSSSREQPLFSLAATGGATSSRHTTSQTRAKSNQFTTGLTDNQDGTYHLLVNLSTRSTEPSEDAPPAELPEAVKVSIKIFGVHVEGSPLLFHPLDPQEIMNYNTRTHLSTTSARERDETAASDNGNSSSSNKEFTSVTSFLKYISGGFIQS